MFMRRASWNSVDTVGLKLCLHLAAMKHNLHMSLQMSICQQLSKI